MQLKLSTGWDTLIESEYKKQYFQQLTNFVDDEYQNYTCYPPKESIFKAFDLCDFEKLKVVIIGQDPYHGAGQANGLCFSVYDSVKHPPSLVNIFKEMGSDLNIPYPYSGDLSHWASQGVLLLNATLTVREHEAGSHQKKGWEEFTDAVISKISNEKNQVVFLLWGGYAQKKGRKIDTNKHMVLTSGHPSPLSANRGFWFGNQHFSKTNSYLKSIGKDQVIW